MKRVLHQFGLLLSDAPMVLGILSEAAFALVLAGAGFLICSLFALI